MKYQHTLVAFYGDKDKNNLLWKKIKELQEKIQKVFEGSEFSFDPYQKEKIHATIIGLEGAIKDGKIIGKNFKEIMKEERSLEIELIIDFIHKTELLPIKIKFGGFSIDKNVLFTSRGELPFNRSFSIQKEIIVSMGWPYIKNTYSPALDTLRRRLSAFGAIHKYHNTPNSFDNDFFLVLGNLMQPLQLDNKQKGVLSKLSSDIRDEMESWKNVTVEVNIENLKVIAYQDTKFKKDVKTYDLKELVKKPQMINDIKNSYPEFNNAFNWLNTL